MISFETSGGWFNYRTAAVVVHDAHVLVCRVASGDFWFLPGGRCELMEPSHDAVRRELREELGVEGRVVRLVWVVESFFVLGGRPFHELGFYYLVTLPPDSPLHDTSHVRAFREGAEVHLEARWFPLAEIAALDLRPAFLRAGLGELPDAPHHLVVDEIGDARRS